MPSRLNVVILAAAASAVLSGSALADPLQVERGREVAGQWCASCHVVSDDQSSAQSDAPTFRELARRSNLDPGALAIALFKPHPVMPSLDIGRADVEAMAAYIDSLAESAAADLPRQMGRDIAAANCAGCHAIAGPGPSPEAAAPPFSTFAQRYPIESLAEALAEGIVVGHGEGVAMPEFVLDPPDIGALLAYLESVQL